MSEEGLEAQRRKKMEKLMAQQQAEEQLRSALRQLLSPAAYDRLSNVRAANPELYGKTAQTLAYLAQNGQLRTPVEEDMLVKLLQKLSEKPETKIEFKSK